MNVTRHFSDTRTAEGRVRFLLNANGAQLIAEGHGWNHTSDHATLEDAMTFLATLPRLSQTLYEEALRELQSRIDLEREYPHAA